MADAAGRHEKVPGAMRSPRELEKLYREAPEQSARVLPDILSQRPESITLQVWQQRLFFEERQSAPPAREGGAWNWRRVALVVTLSLVARTLVKAPGLVRSIDEQWFYSRNLAFIIAAALMIYFWVVRR